MTVLIQIASRILLVEAFVLVPEAQDTIWLYGILVAWGITEVVRYSFYALKLLGREIPLLTWLRYTLFLVLYPLGVLSELFCIHSVVNKWGGWDTVGAKYAGYKLPLQLAYYSLYVPFFPVLYGHMLHQ